jgi:hypothetical protein
MKQFLVFISACLTLWGCSNSKNDPSLDKILSDGNWIDLSYSFSDSTLYWPNNPTGFKLDTQMNGITPAGFYYSSNTF